MRAARETGAVRDNREIAPGIFAMRLAAPSAGEARPGQFFSLYCADASRLLPRPISLCRIDADEVTMVYRVAGAGTAEFSALKEGDSLEYLGPLGNGFPICEGHALLLGGGIGLPPLLELARRLPGPVTVAAGYRGPDLFLLEDFAEYAEVLVATEDGSAGTRGNVLDAVRAAGKNYDVIYACGPTPMLRAVKAFAKEEGVPAWLSLEERMACGMGACLGCVTGTVKEDSHSKVNNARVCRDGPVFSAEEVLL